MAIQIDIKKSFDTLHWNLVLQALNSFGFCKELCNWISNIFNSTRISVLLNGSPAGFFSCSLGVWQGDLLSPLLFNIVEDFLSRYLSSLRVSSALQLLSTRRNFIAPFHLLYVDDIAIVCKAFIRNVDTLRATFDLYERIFGQSVSVQK